jgi:hypothetical protein
MGFKQARCGIILPEGGSIMRIAPVLVAFSLCAVPAAAMESRPDAAKCQARADVHQARRADSARPRRLDRLPPGNLELAVWREIERCPVPAIVRYDVAPRR